MVACDEQQAAAPPSQGEVRLFRILNLAGETLLEGCRAIPVATQFMSLQQTSWLRHCMMEDA